VKDLLGLGPSSIMSLLLPAYKIAAKMKADWFFKELILPKEYIQQIKDLDQT
jgi:hypothetical protein